MSRFGLCGGSYTSQSVNADCQKTQNWYPELLESDGAKSRMAMYPTPGLSLFKLLPDTPVRCLKEINGRLFAVAGSQFCEVSAAGVISNQNAVATDANPAYIAIGNTMLSIASGGHLYAFNLTTNVFTEVDTTSGAALQGRVSQVFYSDGYYIAVLAISDKWQISGLLDATAWDPLDIAQVEVFPDNIVGGIVDHRELLLCGPKSSQFHANTGNPLFPYEVIPGGFIEQGLAAANSLAKLDNSIFMLGSDERGQGVVWRFAGYVPQRISNHAVEFAFQSYATISDAIGYAYQDQGHPFYVIYFPTADKTWVYDVATGMWHEWSSLVNKVPGAHLGRCHVLAFGKHLVGDRNSGNLYEMKIPYISNGAWLFADDNGTPIQRVRRAPHISTERERICFSQLEIYLESGLGPVPALRDGDDQETGPQLMLRWSKDGGHTWSNYHLMDAGKAGEFRKRLIRRRMGIARDMVFEISTSDPIPWRVTDAYLQASPGFSPSERLSSQVQKTA